MAKGNNDIPQDIIDQILPCLPVKSLMRFKCVSKSWRSLITSPLLIRNHFKRASTQDPKTIPQKILIKLPCGFKSLDLKKSFEDEAAAALRGLRFPSNEPSNHVKILESCNGLVCLSLDDNQMRHIFLWNPSTGAFKKLPECNVIRIKSSYFHSNYFCGFGYDSSSDDYKLLLEINTKLVIFSLSKNSWRIIHYEPAQWPDDLSTRKGFYSNGALYWKHYNRFIELDLKTESIDFVRRAPDTMLSRSNFRIFEVGETICVAHIDNLKCSLNVDLWMKKKDSIKGTSIKLLDYINFNDFLAFFNTFLSNNSKGTIECITENEKDTIRFEGEGGVVQKFSIPNFRKQYEAMKSPYSYCEAIIYEETLVSPN